MKKGKIYEIILSLISNKLEALLNKNFHSIFISLISSTFGIPADPRAVVRFIKYASDFEAYFHFYLQFHSQCCSWDLYVSNAKKMTEISPPYMN